MDSALARIAALADVSIDELAAVRLVPESHARGSYVFRYRDAGEWMYLVLEGQISLEIDGSVVGLVRPGEWFGELALFSAGLRTADARVAVDAELVRVDRPTWLTLAECSPSLVASLCERLSRQLRASTEPRRRPVRTVVACVDARGWLPELVASIGRECPHRAVRTVDSGGEALERELADLVALDLLVLATAPEAAALADRRLVRTSETSWTITPGYGGRPVDRIDALDPAVALARVARRLARGTIGLALGAGGAYGFAHIGLMEILEEQAIPIDYVAGTSMGAVIGAYAAAEVSASRMRAFAESAAGRFRSIVLRDLDLTGRTLLTGRGVLRLLAEIDEVRGATFESLRIPFVVCATDIGTGEEVIIDSGPLLEGIQPSFTMPGIFPPCERDGRRLIDGAMVNPVPVDRVRAMGADLVIALQPIPPLSPAPLDPLAGLLGRARRLARLLPIARIGHTLDNLDVSLRSFQTLWQRLAVESAETADVTITPDLQGYWFLQFGAAESIIDIGRRAAELSTSRIRSRI